MKSFFQIKIDGNFLKISLEQIYYFRAHRRYSEIMYKDKNGKFKLSMLTRNLGNILAELDEEFFRRCHKSYIVNLVHITKYNCQNEIIFDEIENDPINKIPGRLLNTRHIITYNKDFKKFLE